MKNSALRAIAQYNMITSGDHLAVALSGGADSVALLHFLMELAEDWQLHITALHLNHMLRGEESERDELFVRKLCAKLHVPVVVGRAKVAELAKERKETVEECARGERYAFFERNAPPSCKIATAHTLSDHAETLILNITRGTGLRGLCGIPPVRDRVIRPLIQATREQVEAYCKEYGLSYVTDSSNLCDLYSRNRIRHDVIPVLRTLNPEFLKNAGEMMALVRIDSDYLDRLAKEQMGQLALGENCYDRHRVSALVPPLKSRAVLFMLRERGIPYDRKRIDGVAALMQQAGGALQLSKEWFCRCDEQCLVFYKEINKENIAFSPVVLKKPILEQVIPIFKGKKIRLLGQDYEFYKESKNSSEKVLKNTLDYDRIDEIIEIRQRMPGDRIKLAGRGCTKSLKKLYNEAGISPEKRDRLLVAWGENGLLWAEGFGVCESCAPTPKTRRVMIFEVLEEE